MQIPQFIISVVSQFGRDKYRGHYVLASALESVEASVVCIPMLSFFECFSCSDSFQSALESTSRIQVQEFLMLFCCGCY
jgi:hypothetical protein